jgi:hypothetical protein
MWGEGRGEKNRFHWQLNQKKDECFDPTTTATTKLINFA